MIKTENFSKSVFSPFLSIKTNTQSNINNKVYKPDSFESDKKHKTNHKPLVYGGAALVAGSLILGAFCSSKNVAEACTTALKKVTSIFKITPNKGEFKNTTVSSLCNNIGILEKNDNVPIKLVETVKEGILKIKNNELEKIGEGKFGIAYRFGDLVIKKQKLNDDFSTEMEILSSLPKDLYNAPSFVARLKENETNYLVTKFVNAKKIHPFNNPITTEQLPELFDDFFKLDKAGIYHDDLSACKGNLLIGDNKIKILDFGCSKKFKVSDKLWNCPSFFVPTNAFDFEEKTLIHYLQELECYRGGQSSQELLCNYLKEKSVYHSKRAKYLADNLDLSLKENLQTVKFEQLEAKFLSIPTDMITEIEKLKMMIVYYNRRADDMGARILENMQNKHNALNASKELAKKANEMLIRTYDDDLEEYLNFQIKYSEFWANSLSTWIKNLKDANPEMLFEQVL